MSGVRALCIKRGETIVGTLFDLDDGRSYFRFSDDYVLDQARPILSAALIGDNEAETRILLMDPKSPYVHGDGPRKLPRFFRNLLPEGVLRKQLIADAGIRPDDEMALLSYCGEDLPGDISATREELNQTRMQTLLTNGHDSFEFSSFQLPTPEAVSLSGVQPKIELVMGQNGRYVMRSKLARDGLHFIGKLPASDFERLPELEHLSMALARSAGVTTADTALLPLTDIADNIPFTLRDDAKNFLLVKRFDRDAPTPTGRRHMEDFAQLLDRRPEDKYQGSYFEIGAALLLVSAEGEDDVFELLRRIKVNELLGNYDAHLKNFSLLYGSDGLPRLSPAYDIVAYGAYLDGKGHALRMLPDQAKPTRLTPSVLRDLANSWRMPEKVMRDVLTQTVDQAVKTWPDQISASSITGGQKEKLLTSFDRHPDVQANRRRKHTSRRS